MTDLDTPPRSPCLKKCQLHPIDRICLGCFRRIEEIEDWARFDNERRAHILSDLPTRRASWDVNGASRRRWR